MHHKSNFREEENHDQIREQRNESEQTVKDFASVEEVLRYDAEQTAVPGELRERVRQSVAQEAKRPWWSRFLKSKD